MASVTYVKHARARYEMVPKTDEQGNPVQVPVTRKDGSPKTTKHGRPVMRTLTVQDRSRPLPNYKCGKCGKEILPGMPYKWIEPRSGPYGGRLMVRCTECPNWNIWEYSSSLSARIAELQFNASTALEAEFDSEDDLRSIMDEIATDIRSLAEEKEEAASNMEDGFGHETYQSQEIADQAQSLNDWADEVENVTIPDLPEPEEQDCEECDGNGEVDCSECGGDGCDDCDGGRVSCEACNGIGQVQAEDPTDEQMDDWREEARSAVQEAIDNCPL
jgi:hypothetical protein